MSDNLHQQARDYKRIEEIVNYLEQNFRRQPELKEIAGYAGLSEFHLQRLFKRWVGISPKRFIQFLTKEHAKALLRQSTDVLSATFASGLSGPGRLHDLFVHCEAVTPGEYKQLGAGIQIVYGRHQTPFGSCLVAQTGRGICGLFFLQDGDDDKYIRRLEKDWPAAEIKEDPEQTAGTVERIFSIPLADPRPVSLFVKGTNFQIKVWEALLKIPKGGVVSYETIAARIGQPAAVRAVGSAVASNPVSFLIPCHRVIRKFGDFGNYQGGPARKKVLLAWEAAQASL
jgi:AraC family transcriptional regulator, regulatory protein of adaptative response / methylated-DNA-[protein]-cysteine methyltransferase